MAFDPRVYDKVNTAAPGGGIYIDPGIYPRVRIKSCKHVSGFRGESFIAELEIIESQVPSRPAGSSMSFVANLKHDLSMSNIRWFLAAALNCKFDDVTGDHTRAAVSESNPMAGAEMRLIATVVPTKKEGGKFTKCEWAYLGGGWPAKVAAAAGQATQTPLAPAPQPQYQAPPAPAPQPPVQTQYPAPPVQTQYQAPPAPPVQPQYQAPPAPPAPVPPPPVQSQYPGYVLVQGPQGPVYVPASALAGVTSTP